MNTPTMALAKFPPNYEKARTQLEKCVHVDECKDWADKAKAMMAYAKQADDKDLELYARRIRLRALTRAGELFKEFEPKHTGRPKIGVGTRPNSRKSIAERAGMSDHQRKTAIRLASIPKAKRERLIEAKNPPTVEQLAAQGTKTKPRPLVDLKGRDPEDVKKSTTGQAALHFLLDAAQSVSTSAVARGAFDNERPVLIRQIAVIEAWLSKLKKDLKKLL